MASRATAARPTLIERAGPFTGMRSTMRGAAEPGFAEWLHNCYPVDPMRGGEIVPRPGRQSFPLTNVVQLGGSGADPRRVQLWTPFPLGANSGTVAIVAGTFYYGQAGGTWDEALTAADLAAAGVTLDTTTLYGATVFNGKLVVCSPSQAWTWNGTFHAGITVLTNAGSSFYGKPTVYAGKLFFIRGTQRTIVWSEEGDETIGYEAGGYANAWDLRQTSSEPLVALLGTNVALYFFRRQGIGAVFGGSAADFQTTATLDAVSASEGTDSAWGVVLAHDTVWFLDNEGRPKCFTVGSTDVQPVWHDLERAWGTSYEADGRGYQYLAEPNSEKASFADYGSLVGHAAYFSSLDMVFFALPYLRGHINFNGNVLLGFHASTRRLQTVWSFPTPIAGLCESYDPLGFTGQYGLVMVDSYGWPYSLTRSVILEVDKPGIIYTDQDHLSGTRVPVTASVIGPRHFVERADEVRVRRLDVNYLGSQPGTLSVRWATPSVMVHGAVLAVENDADPLAPGMPADLPTDGLADRVGAAVPPVEGHAALGLDELARWIAFGFSWDASATQLRLLGYEVRAVPAGPTPGAY